MTLEELLKKNLKENKCYSKEKMDSIVYKLIKSKEEVFRHLHKEIIPMLQD